MCCLDCENLRLNLRGEHETAIGLDCWDRDRFIRRTNADVWAIVDRLRDARPAMGNTEFKKLESELGFHWVPHGIIADLTLRDIYKPVDHTIRDWMHTLVGDGQANSTIGETLRAIKNHGFATEYVQEFLMNFKLPHKHGKPHAAWLKSSRVKPHTHFRVSLALSCRWSPSCICSERSSALTWLSYPMCAIAFGVCTKFWAS